MKKKTILTIILIVAALVIVFVVYGALVKSPQTVGSLSSQTGATSATTMPVASAEATAAREELLLLLRSISNITLDSSILTQQSFRSLRDISILLPPEKSRGRPNPFAPYGVGDNSSQGPLINPQGGAGSGTNPRP